jgi:hypothetical protein
MSGAELLLPEVATSRQNYSDHLFARLQVLTAVQLKERFFRAVTP